MINSLEFKKFNISFSDLTENTIIIFDTIETLREFYSEFENLIENKDYEHILYSTIDNVNNITIEEFLKCRGLTIIYKVNNTQRFICTLEPMSVLTMKSYDDLWFVSKENDIWNVFSFTEYENYMNYKSNEDIYKFVCKSRYGCGSDCKN